MHITIERNNDPMTIHSQLEGNFGMDQFWPEDDWTVKSYFRKFIIISVMATEKGPIVPCNYRRENLIVESAQFRYTLA